MFEPQSTVVLAALLPGFAALLWWLTVSRRIALRIVAGGVAFALAMSFGICSA